MKKEVIFDKRAYDDLSKFPLEVIAAFDAALEILEREGKLESPLGKKIEENLFEVLIRHEGSWRCFYAYLKGDKAIVLHVFQKKTQRTSRKEIGIAKKRLQDHV